MLDEATELGVEMMHLRAGCRATTPEGDRWLRVVTEPLEWAGGPAWIGNAEANRITRVAKPIVLDVTEWDVTGLRARAELMTLAPGTRISSDMALRQAAELDDDWWTTLRGSLDTLANQPNDRVCLDAQSVHRRLLATFGIDVDLAGLSWSTAHGDLHWANLTAPRCWLLDWESWGTAPTGYDAALLLCTSLLQPEAAEQVRVVFADVLDTPQGRTAQLLAAAKLLDLVKYGDHPDLAIPVHRHASRLI